MPNIPMIPMGIECPKEENGEMKTEESSEEIATNRAL